MHPEDVAAIDAMVSEIKSKRKRLDYRHMAKHVNLLKEKHVGRYPDKVMLSRKRLEMYSYFSAETLEYALRMFLESDYNIKRIAKSCVLNDEDYRFIESMDVGRDVGTVWSPDGSKRASSIIEVVMKPMPYGMRNRVTGMPFRIIEFRLIVDDVPERNRTGQRKKKEAVPEPEGVWTQLSMFG